MMPGTGIAIPSPSRQRGGGPKATEPDLPSDQELQRLFDNPRFARASRYPARWVAENQMGPNVLWLTEWLCEGLELQPGMRVLDLGCGRALSSIYLAREHGVHVMACDLWVAPGDNWERIVAAGMADQVTPIHAEAHALPFAETFFDAIVALDAYTYFGTDDLYLGYLVRYLCAGGRLGIVVPGLMREIRTPPPHLTRPQAHGKAFWEPDCWCFHTAAWWQRHWQRTGLVEAVEADVLEDGWRHWAQHERAIDASGFGLFPSDAEAIEADRGRTLGFVRALARRKADVARGAPHVWEPAFRARSDALFAARDRRQSAAGDAA
jgi:SAM-dependent methyltransferase